MAPLPQNPAGMGSPVDGLPITKNQAASFVDVASNLTLFNKPSVSGIIQNFPGRDGLLRQLIDDVVGTERVANTINDTWYNTFMDPLFGPMTVNASTAAGGPGQSVTVTLAAGSYIQDGAMAFDNYVYWIQRGTTTYQCFCPPGGVNDATPNAWTVTLFPQDTSVTLPAFQNGDPIKMMFSTSVEGNTTHSASGRIVPVYTFVHGVAPRETHGVSITDLAAFSNPSWFTGTIQMADGRTVDTQYWTNVEVDAAIQGWDREVILQRFFDTGQTISTGANARLASMGVDRWIETYSGNVFTWNGVSISDTDIISWIDSLKLNYEGVSEYTIIAGTNLQRAIQAWIPGPHFAGQVQLVDNKNFDLDFTSFKWYNTTFHVPVKPLIELDNQSGMGQFGYTNVGYMIPRGKTSTMDSTGMQRPYLSWRVLKNTNTQFPGVQGARFYTWTASAQFGKAFGIQGSDGGFIPTADQIAELHCNTWEGHDHVKAYMFGKIKM